MYESPLQVDDPFAAYRVQCPSCRQNVWAGLDVPPARGEDILAEHTCPEDQPQQDIEPEATARKPRAEGQPEQSPVYAAPSTWGTSGHPAQPGPPLE